MLTGITSIFSHKKKSSGKQLLWQIVQLIKKNYKNVVTKLALLTIELLTFVPMCTSVPFFIYQLE